MPKGFPSVKSKATSIRPSSQLVPPGAKFFPGTECAGLPEGTPIPDGLRIRTSRGVEVRFNYEGERVSETVRGKPTVAFVELVARKRERIQQLIGLGKFGAEEYLEEFPDSARFQLKQEEKRPLTVGEALDEWYLTRKHTYGPNTDKDHIRAIHNQLMPLKLPAGLFNDADFIRPRPDYEPPASWSLSRYQGGPARPVDASDMAILAHLPISLLSDVVINVIRSELRKNLSIKRIKNLMLPLSGALERQFKLNVLAVNPFKLLSPLKDTEVAVDGINSSAESNPCDLDAPLPDSDGDTFRTDEGTPDPFSEEDVRNILAELDAPMVNQFVFSFWTGLRTGETIGLRLSDIQLDRKRIFVRRSVSRGVLKNTKSHKQRWVNLLPPAEEALRAQIKLFGAPDGWLFPNPFTKKRWANDSKITKRWSTALEKARVRYRNPYHTRHTFASMLLTAGENIMYVASQMGHADWSMLVKSYGAWIPSSAANQPGELVTIANIKNWMSVSNILKERQRVLATEDDYEE